MKRIIFIAICLLFSIIYCSAQYTVTTNVKTPKNSTVPDTKIFTGTDFSYTSTQLAALAADLQANYSAELMPQPRNTTVMRMHGMFRKEEVKYGLVIVLLRQKIFIGQMEVT